MYFTRTGRECQDILSFPQRYKCIAQFPPSWENVALLMIFRGRLVFWQTSPTHSHWLKLPSKTITEQRECGGGCKTIETLLKRPLFSGSILGVQSNIDQKIASPAYAYWWFRGVLKTNHCVQSLTIMDLFQDFQSRQFPFLFWQTWRFSFVHNKVLKRHAGF